MFYNKQTLSLNKLYAIHIPQPFNNLDLFYPTVFIKGGSVNIYASGSSEVPTSISDMVLNKENTNISGYDSFFIIPQYIYVTQNSGTTTEIIIDGLNANEIGDLS